MGFTLPKLPLGKLFSKFDSDSTASGLILPDKKPHVKKPHTDIAPPEWLETIEGYHIVSCRWHDAGGFGSCVSVGYHPNDFSNSEDMGFVKVYAIDENPHWKFEGKPFPQMKAIWKEIHDGKQIHSITYSITEDGRIYSDMMGFPSEQNISYAIYDISSMYSSWKMFPNAPTYEMVRKLCHAQQAVDKMREETKHRWSERSIEDMRQKIKELQNDISQVERNLNTMYEEAADGMNLLEEYGVKVNLDEETEEEKKKEPGGLNIEDMVSGSGFSNPRLNYIGNGSIRKRHDGTYVVTPDANAVPNLGDMVIDRRNGLSAVYSLNRIWEVVND